MSPDLLNQRAGWPQSDHHAGSPPSPRPCRCSRFASVVAPLQAAWYRDPTGARAPLPADRTRSPQPRVARGRVWSLAAIGSCSLSLIRRVVGSTLRHCTTSARPQSRRDPQQGHERPRPRRGRPPRRPAARSTTAMGITRRHTVIGQRVVLAARALESTAELGRWSHERTPALPPRRAACLRAAPASSPSGAPSTRWSPRALSHLDADCRHRPRLRATPFDPRVVAAFCA